MQSNFDKWFRFVAVPVGGFVLYVSLLIIDHGATCADFGDNCAPYAYLSEIAISVLGAVLIVESALFVANRLNRTLPWERSPGRRFGAQAALQLSVVVGALLLLGNLVPLVHPSITDASTHRWSIVVVGTIGSLLLLAVHTGGHFFRRWKTTLLEAEEIKRTALQAQLDSLRAQVDPHFVFNSMNTLATIIAEDQKKAIEFVQRLAQVYRYVLQSRAAPTVPLATELTFARAYVFLCTARFEEGLQVDIDVPQAALNNEIPPLALQHLLENAIKHNVVSRERPLRIRVFLDEARRLVVQNNRQPKATAEASTKMGLDNMVARHKLLGHGTVVIEESTSEFTVRVPLAPSRAGEAR